MYDIFDLGHFVSLLWLCITFSLLCLVDCLRMGTRMCRKRVPAVDRTAEYEKQGSEMTTIVRKQSGTFTTEEGRELRSLLSDVDKKGASHLLL